MESLKTWIWLQQDYFWFVSGLGWLVVGVSWWRYRDDPKMPGWIFWSALAGFLTAGTEILSIIFAKTFVPGEPQSFPAEMALGGIEALLVFGWWFSGLRGHAGRTVLSSLIAALLVFITYWRIEHPNEAIVLTSLLFGGAMVWWLFGRSGESPAWRVAMVVTGGATLLGTGGPASILTYEPRRLVEMSEVGPWAAFAQIVALLVILVVWPKAERDEMDTEESARETRWFWTAAGVWLAFGLLFAVGAGMLGLAEFKRHALQRVQLATQVLEKERVEQLVSEEFKVTDVFRWAGGDKGVLLTKSNHVGEYGPPVVAQLVHMGEAFPDIGLLTLTTLRDGWLAMVASNIPGKMEVDPESVSLFRRVSERDSKDWADKRGGFLDPTLISAGWSVVARAPILGSAGQMLGWLNLEYSVTDWVAAQAQRRSMAYLVVALGLGIGRQLLNRRMVERSRARAQQKALAATQANKLKTTFLANVSHELRTPLQTIMGYTDLLLPNMQTKDRQRLLAVREHADLMGRLVNDLIDLSAAESGNFHLLERPIALVDHITQTVESFRPQAEIKGLRLNIHAAPEIPNWLKADPQRVRQVVLNLVSNAIKYTDHGQVDVALELAGRRDGEVILEFHVADTGPGVAPGEQAQLFSAFSRLDRTIEREGTGLGLAVVAAISRAMRGSVRVESDGRTGSRFVARWSLHTTTAPVSGAREKVPLHGMRVLITDDNALVRDLFVALLTECGAVCATASDGEEAMQRLYREPFDAVVLDLAMPKLDGISTVRRLRRTMPEHLRRIVGVSAHAGAKDHQNALAAGMDAFLVKPVTLPDLARALAPTVTEVPQIDSLNRIRSHFEQRFRSDAATQTALVARAWERGKWNELLAAAHHLKNSADVVGDVELARACAALEEASRAQDRSAGDDAWVSCKRALIRWLPEPSEN